MRARRSVHTGAVRSGGQGPRGGKRGCVAEECVSGKSIQAEPGRMQGQDVRAQGEEGGGLPPSRGPDPEGRRMGGRAHLSGGGWQQQYGPDYKEGIDSISTHIKNGHQQEKL